MKQVSTSQQFPDTSNLPRALSADNQLTIDGAKVVFDRKVSLMPVDLEEIPPQYRRNRPQHERR